jgi:hypothetical protein
MDYVVEATIEVFSATRQNPRPTDHFGACSPAALLGAV